MMKTYRSASTINKMKRHYRRLIETHPDPKVKRMAQAMETALRWVTEDTRNWPMRDEPVLLARCLDVDLKSE